MMLSLSLGLLALAPPPPSGHAEVAAQVDALKGAGALWTGCKAHDDDACYTLSRLRTVRVPEEQRALTQPLEAGCGRGEGAACFALAMTLDDDGGAPPDGKRAFELFGTACRAGFVPACAREAVFYVVSVPSRQPDAKTRASELLSNACDAGLTSACADRVALLGVEARAVAAPLLAGCAQGLPLSCSVAAGLPGLPKAQAAGLARLRRRCAAHVQGACEDLKQLAK